jgi:hypothetical protein
MTHSDDEISEDQSIIDSKEIKQEEIKQKFKLGKMDSDIF